MRARSHRAAAADRRISRIHRLVPAMVLAVLATPPGAAAQQAANASVTGTDTLWAADPPRLGTLVDFGRTQSDLRVAVERFSADAAALRRRYDIPGSPVLRQRQREFYDAWLARLRELDFDALNREGQVDYVLLRNRIEFELAMLDERRSARRPWRRWSRSRRRSGCCRRPATWVMRPDARGAAQTLAAPTRSRS
jgi:hypothetical protein